MLRSLGLTVLAFVVLVGLPSAARATSVTLMPSVASPQKLGTPVTWTATVQSPVSGHTYDYQFSFTFNGQKQVVSDFSPTNTFPWVPHTVEGAYQFNVVVRDITTAPFVIFAPVSVNYTLLPWVTTPLAAGAVNPTTHPLVALFSAPPCLTGHQVLVRFNPSTSSTSMTTNLVPCSPQSANFYVAGMYPLTEYMMHWEEYADAGATLVNTGSDLSFTTGPLPSNLPAIHYQVNVAPTADDAAYPVLLHQASVPTATDLAGNIMWYFANDIGLTPTQLAMARMEPGGLFYLYPTPQIFQLNDLAGNMVLQTNIHILNEQLAAKGYPQMIELNAHEGRNMPDGNIVLLGARTVVSTSAQGGTPTKPVTIVGDMVLVVDHNLQLVWAWDSFAHEDINRVATLNDQGGGGTNDWLHTNSAQGTADGNIIISQRSQDWALKINYANGKGDGSIIWHMGAGQDFTIVNPPTNQTCNSTTIPGNPNIIPWFTHQHDVHYDFLDDASGSGFMIMTVFDDGNTRNAQCPGTQNSRGMVLLVNEATRQIYFETLADLGGYSAALGSAQVLTPPSGNVYSSFDSGILPGGNTQVSEVKPPGQIVYQMQTNQATYRAYRMQNLYTPTEFEPGRGGGLAADEAFDFSSGFAQDHDSLQFNGNAALSGSSIELTDGGINEAGSAYYGIPVNIQTFTTDFTFQLTNANADGFTFAIQNSAPTALGASGGSLGYAGVGTSVAVKFDLFSNRGEGPNSTGVYVDGGLQTCPRST